MPRTSRFSSLLPLLTGVGILAVLAGILLPLEYPVSWDDGLRHITMAREMLTNGFGIGWSRFFYAGYLYEHLVDPWFLANFSYMPFVSFSDATALHLYSLMSVAILLLTFWWVIRPFKLPPKWSSLLLLMLLLGDQLFTQRILIARPFVFTSAFTLIMIKVVLERRVLLAALCMLVATLFSQLFVFPLFVLGCGCLWIYTLGERKKSITLATAGLIGVFVGILIHPHSWEYMQYIVLVFSKIPFMKHIRLGGEMYSGFSSSNSLFALVGAIISLTVTSLVVHGKPKLNACYKSGLIFVAIMFVLFYIMYFLWARAIDLLWPVGIVLLAVFLSQIHECITDFFSYRSKRLHCSYGTITCIFICTALLVHTFIIYTNNTERNQNHPLRGSEEFALIEPNSRVLNLDWDLLPVFISIRPDLKFASGIDNTFAYLENEKGYELLSVYFSHTFYLEKPIIDTSSWITQLLEHYPADYFLVWGERSKNIRPVLYKTPELTRLTESGAEFDIFAVNP